MTMSIADHPTWVQTIDNGVAAMHQAYAGRGWYDSHDLVNWLIEHSEPVLKDIIESYRLKGDGAPVRDPYMIATRRIAKGSYCVSGGQLASIEYHLKLLCDRHLWRDFLRSRHLL
jgi:hypothetical protein